MTKGVYSGISGAVLIASALFILSMLSLQVSALSVDISIDTGKQFVKSETMFFNYSLISDEDAIVSFIPFLECPDALDNLIAIEYADLTAGVPFYGTYFYGEVGNFPPQECKASVFVLETNQSKKGTVTIATDSVFSYDIHACENLECVDNTLVFLKGQTVYLTYKSDVSGIETFTELLYPNGDVVEITLPYSFKVSENGVYSVESSAAKEGYQANGDYLQFAVIEETPEISRMEDICNTNSLCEPERGETSENCIYDCPETSGQSENDYALYLIILMLFAVMAFVWLKKSGKI